MEDKCVKGAGNKVTRHKLLLSSVACPRAWRTYRLTRHRDIFSLHKVYYTEICLHLFALHRYLFILHRDLFRLQMHCQSVAGLVNTWHQQHKTLTTCRCIYILCVCYRERRGRSERLKRRRKTHIFGPFQYQWSKKAFFVRSFITTFIYILHVIIAIATPAVTSMVACTCQDQPDTMSASMLLSGVWRGGVRALWWVNKVSARSLGVGEEGCVTWGRQQRGLRVLQQGMILYSEILQRSLIPGFTL